MAARVNLPGASGGEPPKEPPAPEPKAEVGPKVVPLDEKAKKDLGAIGAVRDTKGRILAMRKTRFSAKMAVSSLVGGDDSVNPVVYSNAIAACSVAAIDGDITPMPTTHQQLEQIWDWLDDHGAAAARHFLYGQSEDEEAVAKN